MPSYNRPGLVPRIVHFGVGGFHRSHLARYCDELATLGSDWGIHGIGLLASDERMAQVLDAQDGLYTLTERAGADRATSIIGSIIDYTWCPPGSDETPVVELVAAPTTAILSMTITEAGYSDEPRNRRTFDLIAAGLAARYERSVGPLTVMSCDNVVSNGAVVQRCVVAAAGRRSPELARWVVAECSFPNSMVDRITPATTDADREYIVESFGLIDGWPVACEPFRQWVLEDNFVSGRPQFSDVGVLYSDDVHAWELYKLRMLNAGHSTIAYLSALAGIEFVDIAMATPQIARFLDRFLHTEAVPSLDAIAGHPREDYVAAVVARFSNFGVRDQIARLCIDGTAKFSSFLIPTIQTQLANNRPIRLAALALAGWCHYLATTPVERQASDPGAGTARQVALAAIGDPGEFLNLDLVFPAAVRDAGLFRAAFVEAHRRITDRGVLPAIDAVLDAY